MTPQLNKAGPYQTRLSVGHLCRQAALRCMSAAIAEARAPEEFVYHWRGALQPEYWIALEQKFRNQQLSGFLSLAESQMLTELCRQHAAEELESFWPTIRSLWPPARMRAELARLKSVLKGMQSSYSWRLTKPLRALTAAARWCKTLFTQPHSRA